MDGPFSEWAGTLLGRSERHRQVQLPRLRQPWGEVQAHQGR